MITLNRLALAQQGDDDLWLLTVQAVSDDTAVIPHEIFVYHSVLPDAITAADDVFECVASVAQLSDIGTVPYYSGEGPINPYYRVDTMTYLFDTSQEAERVWEAIQDDVYDLVNNINNQSVSDTEVTDFPESDPFNVIIQ